MSIVVTTTTQGPAALLAIIQTVCNRIGIAAPTAVVSSNDQQIIQLLALANEEGEELATGNSVGLNYDWTGLQTEASFTAVAANSQGALTTIAPGFRFMINDTIWDRSTKLPAYGSLSPKAWQAMKAWGVANPYPQFRIQGGNLLLMPAPKANDAYYFEYQSSNWCTNGAGTISRTAFAADDDICVLNSQLMVAGIIWRWKAAKGLDYAEDFRKYQTRVTSEINRDGSKPMLDMGAPQGYQSGIIVPIGNWNTP